MKEDGKILHKCLWGQVSPPKTSIKPFLQKWLGCILQSTRWSSAQMHNPCVWITKKQLHFCHVELKAGTTFFQEKTCCCMEGQDTSSFSSSWGVMLDWLKCKCKKSKQEWREEIFCLAKAEDSLFYYLSWCMSPAAHNWFLITEYFSSY